MVLTTAPTITSTPLRWSHDTPALYAFARCRAGRAPRRRDGRGPLVRAPLLPRLRLDSPVARPTQQPRTPVVRGRGHERRLRELAPRRHAVFPRGDEPGRRRDGHW